MCYVVCLQLKGAPVGHFFERKTHENGKTFGPRVETFPKIHHCFWKRKCLEKVQWNEIQCREVTDEPLEKGEVTMNVNKFLLKKYHKTMGQTLPRITFSAELGPEMRVGFFFGGGQYMPTGF